MKSNKTLTNEYKLRDVKVGVYQIRNTVNNKVLIDGSLDLDKIWNRHCFELRLNGHRNKKLQSEWQEFGESHFVFEILEEIKQSENNQIDYPREVKLLTKMYIDELQPFGDRGYHDLPVR